MKNKINMKRLAIFIVIIIVITVATIMVLNLGKKHILSITDKENIVKIVSEKNNSERKVEISSKEMINNVLNYFIDMKKVSKVKSVADVPNVEEYYMMTLKDTDEKMYIYQNDNKYYIEKPYDGIYSITEEEYNNILKMLYLD